MNNWSDNYIELSFEMGGRERPSVDCWGLVRLIYLENLSIDLPSYSNESIGMKTSELRRIACVMNVGRERWTQVFDPSEYDAVLLKAFGNIASHVGVMIDSDRFIHIMDGTNASIDRISGLSWRNRIEGFYRYE